MPTARAMLSSAAMPIAVLVAVTGDSSAGKLAASAGTARNLLKASKSLTGWWKLHSPHPLPSGSRATSALAARASTAMEDSGGTVVSLRWERAAVAAPGMEVTVVPIL